MLTHTLQKVRVGIYSLRTNTTKGVGGVFAYTPAHNTPPPLQPIINYRLPQHHTLPHQRGSAVPGGGDCAQPI